MAIRVIVCVLRMISMWCVKDTLQFGSSDYRIRFNILQPEKSLSLHTFIGFDMLRTVLIVGIGSFFGGVSRYLLSEMMKGGSSCFPWGTLTVNLLGCFLIGLLAGLLSRLSEPFSNWSLFLITGFCGSFTTFSTFARESLAMLQAHNIAGFSAYAAVSIIAGIALAAFGYWLVR